MDGGLSMYKEGGARKQPQQRSCCQAGRGTHVLLRGGEKTGLRHHLRFHVSVTEASDRVARVRALDQ